MKTITYTNYHTTDADHLIVTPHPSSVSLSISPDYTGGTPGIQVSLAPCRQHIAALRRAADELARILNEADHATAAPSQPVARVA